MDKNKNTRREQDPKAGPEFQEVSYGYNAGEAGLGFPLHTVQKSQVCGGCPMAIQIPQFIKPSWTGICQGSIHYRQGFFIACRMRTCMSPGITMQVPASGDQTPTRFHWQTGTVRGRWARENHYSTATSCSKREKGGGDRFRPGRACLCHRPGKSRM